LDSARFGRWRFFSQEDTEFLLPVIVEITFLPVKFYFLRWMPVSLPNKPFRLLPKAFR